MRKRNPETMKEIQEFVEDYFFEYHQSPSMQKVADAMVPANQQHIITSRKCLKKVCCITMGKILKHRGFRNRTTR